MVAVAFGVVFALQLWVLAALALCRLGTTRPAPKERFDAIVVLGCRVRGGVASPAFVRRLELACGLWRDGVAPKLVITGGAVGDATTEAEAGRAYVVQRSLAPVDAIVLESEARTTRENAAKTRALLGDARVLVVTTDWHVPRATRIFRRSFTHVAAASAPGKMRGALREVFASVLG